MNSTLTFTRILFLVLSVFFMTTYMVSMPADSLFGQSILGVILGLLLGGILLGFDILLKKQNLKSFNIATLGLFFGYLMGLGLVLLFKTILKMSALSLLLDQPKIEIIKIFLFLFGTYLGTIITLRSAHEISVSIPFIKFTPTSQKKKDFLLDASVLSDARLIDLASTGILDHSLIVPSFVIKELYAQAESGDEHQKAKAKKSLETLKKLEEIPSLGLRYNDTDFTDAKETNAKLFRLARLLDCNILSSDISKVQISSVEGIRIVNLHSLSSALKPLMQAGEKIKIKIQRYGKEPRQGVGYLEDGTMVVVNGGGDYISEVIDALVLSVKHTASGRMIFCNTVEEAECANFVTSCFSNEY